MREENVYYNTKMDTYKIFLKPIENRLGDLRAWNIPRMLTADNEHHDLFGKDVGKNIETLPSGYKSYKITSKEKLFNIIFHDRHDPKTDLWITGRRDPKTGDPVTDVAFTYCYKSDGRLYLCKTNGKRMMKNVNTHGYVIKLKVYLPQDLCSSQKRTIPI
jgi:hypothetical protein